MRPQIWQPTRLPPSLGFSRQEHWSGLPFPSQCVKVKLLSHVRLLATPWTAAYQAPQSMGFSRQEYWSGLPLPSSYASTKEYNSSGKIQKKLVSMSCPQRGVGGQGQGRRRLHFSLLGPQDFTLTTASICPQYVLWPLMSTRSQSAHSSCPLLHPLLPLVPPPEQLLSPAVSGPGF